MSSTDAPGAYESYDRSRIDRGGQAEAFDAIGDRYDEAFPHKEGQLVSGGWLAGSLPEGSRVLDIGCGTGLPTARQLAEAGHSVLGVDLSDEMVRIASAEVPQAEFRVMDLADLESAGLGTFDGIAAFFSLLMLPKDEIPVALRMVHGLMRPGGLLALSMVEADVDDCTIPFLGNSIRVSGYLREELRALVEEAGLEVETEDAYSFAPATSEVAPEIQLFLNCRRP
ncbi:class I SAM-dependent methyltransferase [Streptomyces sp. P38-E01]|uniref:Class I SAM-dependent methyltransferase n=1 Tax=Streptomyces tardus TaxID=2780544 RepID=A0A949JGQ4_9ACTN|nr:class I SAM-dependent methyltransferase [Streptomyces tardus]MBU7599127.1 class I SAM-dependent methyltransferase [Streptomyces tardus]